MREAESRLRIYTQSVAPAFPWLLANCIRGVPDLVGLDGAIADWLTGICIMISPQVDRVDPDVLLAGLRDVAS